MNAGQLLIIGFEGLEIGPRLASLLRRLQPAGVILFARNIKTPEQTWRLLRDCQRCVEAPLFTCVDLEGGTVDRFRDALGPAPSPMEVFATCDRRAFRRHGKIIGANCRALGFNVDFAPVFDLAFEASRKVMASRAVSPDPLETVEYVREFLSGLEEVKVLGCGKHFPGLGEGQLDSHHHLPVIAKSLKDLWAEDLLPYRTLRKKLPFVMVSHAAYSRVTKANTPASLSKLWITDVLRKRIGYKNLIVSDDLEMGGVLSASPIGKAPVEFVRAGGDLPLVCHREENVIQAYETLAKSIERDKTLARRVAESARRIASFKKSRGAFLRPSKQPSPAVIQKLTRALWEFGEQVRLEPLSRKNDRRQRT